ncbi:MAG: hypothetical protein K9W45_02030 [Candidatus Heimdallarchaeum aukensis]|uniref:Uncharacterized protein n=1 Tax=Candidatus Heimdallarchaeum aukensis TaxID=2876573 RepID=A0A9Y1BM24_9ARCH|nr:MAG: hypothetical protein K9W45_02030 [Candidatus Heimdallarchaeum aukensis]
MKINLISRKKSLIFGVLLVLVISLSWGVRADSNMKLSITTAYYCDIDGDGFEDDIYAEAIVLADEGFKFYYMEYSLIYPSGNVYSDDHTYYTFDSETTFVFRLTNAATESGWYTLEITLYVLTGGGITVLYDSLEFDPPGGSGDEPIGGGVSP